MSQADIHYCKAIGCSNRAEADQDFCESCLSKDPQGSTQGLSERYPDQYRDLGDMSDIDVHGVTHLFEIPDHSGCIQQASHKLLMTGTSATVNRDVRQARDLLTRWLELNPEH